MPKKRGAPAGNHNAYKHGFYSAAFRATELRLLSEMPAQDLSAEIELIRVTSLRLLQALDAAGRPTDLATQLSALRAVNLSAHSIATLLRTQALTARARATAADLNTLIYGTAAADQPETGREPTSPPPSPTEPPDIP